MYLRSTIQLYDQVYLYAKRIKRLPRKESPKNCTVISSPKMLSTFSPLRSIISRKGSSSQLLTDKEENKENPVKRGRSTFAAALMCNNNRSLQPPKNVGRSASSNEVVKNLSLVPDASEDSADAEEKPVQRVPFLKVNSNDLSWQIEQKQTKDCPPADLSGEVVKIKAEPIKKSKFFVDPDVSPASQDMQEDIKINSCQYQHPTENFETEIKKEETKSVLYCECGNVCEENKSSCNSCLSCQKPTEFSGYLMTIICDKLENYWLLLLNKELYSNSNLLYTDLVYEKKDAVEFIRLYRLDGVFVKKEEKQEEINGEQYHAFSLQIGHKKKYFYPKTREECEQWIQMIRLAIGYSNFFNSYELKGLLGHGKYTEVRAAQHRITNKKVAVKILKKYCMNENQIEKAKSEIETLRLCQHPNIMELYEVYENSDYIYLVLEYLSGGDFQHYLINKQFKISETKAYKFIHSIAHALHYMHTFGIIHRDIKPNNIVMISQSEDSDVKIVDFGLAKFLGPGELVDEGVGTIYYAAPELFRGEKYGKAVDLWSLGVIVHILLVGKLPFYQKDNDKEIVNQILNKEIDYNGHDWKLISPEAKDFVSSKRRIKC